MAKQTINVGTGPNTGTADSIRIAFEKVNANFTELYNLTGATSLTELAQDYAAALFVNGTHSGITVTYDDANNKLNLAVPAGFSGSYLDLTNKPTIPADVSDLTDTTGLLGGGGNANTGDVEFTSSTLATPNTTEVDWPNGVIRLAPGSVSNPDLAAYGQFLNIYPTTAFDAPHIHIAAGSGVNGKGDLLLGDDNQNIEVNNAGYINIKSYDPIRGQQNYWAFDKDGTFYGPGMGTVITNAISGSAGNDLFLSGGNNNVRQSRVVRFTDADGTAKSIYTVDTNIYYVDDISFTNGQPTLWIAPNENASIASITPGVGTATFDFSNPITLLADTDYTIDWYSVDNVTSVTIQSTIRQDQSYTRTTAPTSVSVPTVIWTGTDDWISSAKLTIQVEANELLDPTGWHTQVCEAIIASRGNSGNPSITVYSVTHTSANPLMTFTAQRNVTTNLIEIVGTPTATVDGQAYLRIHSVEMLSRD